MTYIEIESFVSVREHSTVVAGLMTFSRLEKEMQYFIVVSVTGIFLLNLGHFDPLGPLQDREWNSKYKFRTFCQTR